MGRLRILHLTDTHLVGDDSLHHGRVDTQEHLRRALAHVAEHDFDLVVCSGDLSDDGSEQSYRRLRDAVVPWASERGARTVFAMGNHDLRPGFRAVLGEHLPETGPLCSSIEVAGWRVIVLDTSVPGFGYGALGDDQLELLRSIRSAPAQHGTLLVMHHPPIPAQTDLLQALALTEADTRLLWEAVRGSDVRAIFSGHYHLPVVEVVHGIPVIVAPGTANVSRALDDPQVESAIDAFGGAVVEVASDRVRVVPFVERMTPDAEVFRLHADEVRRIAAEAGAE